MRYTKPHGKALCLLAVGAVAMLLAGCSKGTPSTTPSSTTLAPVKKSIGGWSAEQLPDPVGATNALLAGVWCSSDASCTAVGSYGKSSGQFFSILEHWNGSMWSIEPGASAEAMVPSRLHAISCPTASACFVVGESSVTANSEKALVERWNGTIWSVVPVPTPKNIKSTELTAISCYSSTACTAVGSYGVPPTGQTEVLFERWNGLRWAIQRAPGLPKHVTSITFSQVSCSSPEACTAVGQSTESSSSSAVVEYWNGESWAIQDVPVLADSHHSKLSGVSCVSPQDCTAVGDSFNSAGLDVSLVERWNGREWLVEPIPNINQTELALTAVSCPTAVACFAVGRETIAVYSKSGWKVQQAPIPSNALESNCPALLRCRVPPPRLAWPRG